VSIAAECHPQHDCQTERDAPSERNSHAERSSPSERSSHSERSEESLAPPRAVAPREALRGAQGDHGQEATGTAPTLRVETLAGSVAILLAMTVAQRGVGFVRGILFCRWLDPIELGEWDLAFGFLMLAAPVTVLGLTGGYGRYVEHYRQRGQLRSFFRRTIGCVALLVTVAVTALVAWRVWFSQAIFGSPQCESLVLLTAASLVALVAFNTLFELFGGLRLFRLAAGMQFFHSLLFAGLGVALVLVWEPTALSIVAAFGGAYALCAIGSLPWLRKAWRSVAGDAAPLGQFELWRKIVPFAASVWIINWLSNLFDVTDRWMLAHYGAVDAAAALADVGNYHAARVLPLPLVAVASLLRSAILPHLSHDWEAGRRHAVSGQVNFVLKLWGMGLLVVSAALAFAAPTLFEVAFRGKYSGGLEVLSLTVIYLGWEGMASLATSYLWCAERPSLGSLPLAAGLLLNIGLNLLLVPRWGLHGAVAATATAHLLSLALAYLLNSYLGAQPSLAVWLVSLAPASLLLGPWATAAVTLVFLHQAWRRDWLFTSDEKARLMSLVRRRAAAG
jgi:O-antigen/teichoic acid export membrane protein